MDIGAALTDMWRAILLFVPKAVGFLAILVVGFLVARFLRRIVNRLLERVGFDRAVERGGITRFLARSRYDASDIVAVLVYYTVLLFTLQLAFGIWGPNPVSDLIEGVVAWLPRAIVAIVIVVVAAAIASAVKDVITNTLSSLSYGRLLANLAAIFIVGLGVIAALNQIGVATTVTTPVLITVLATIGGILIVGVGGGMIRPMQDRWERWLSKAEHESEAVREQIQAYAAGRRHAMEAAATQPVNAEPVGARQPAGTTYATGTASVETAMDFPAGSRTDYPTDSQPGYATGSRTDYPTGSRSDSSMESRSDSPTVPTRSATPAPRSSNDQPTQVLRPVDPDENR